MINAPHANRYVSAENGLSAKIIEIFFGISGIRYKTDSYSSNLKDGIKCAPSLPMPGVRWRMAVYNSSANRRGVYISPRRGRYTPPGCSGPRLTVKRGRG